MDWKQIYKSRLTTAKEAVKKIKSGDTVVIAHATEMCIGDRGIYLSKV